MYRISLGALASLAEETVYQYYFYAKIMNGEDNVREGGQGPYRGIGVYMILTRINFRKRGVYTSLWRVAWDTWVFLVCTCRPRGSTYRA